MTPSCASSKWFVPKNGCTIVKALNPFGISEGNNAELTTIIIIGNILLLMFILATSQRVLYIQRITPVGTSGRRITQLANMGIGPKFIEPAADVFIVVLQNKHDDYSVGNAWQPFLLDWVGDRGHIAALSAGLGRG